MISKDGFLMLMESMKQQHDFDNASTGNLAKVFGQAVYYNNDAIVAGVLSFLEHEMDDRAGWIELFAYELDYGRAKSTTVTSSKAKVDLSSASVLWDILQK